MKWAKFKNKFHLSWHKEIKPFIESDKCNRIYTKLKAVEDDVIYPSSFNTFRNFKNSNLDKTRAAIFFREPFSDMEPDGVPLSCTLAHRVHPHLNMFYDSMEKEFYGLNLDMLKDHQLDYLIEQDVFMHNVDVTVLRNKPGSHRDLWRQFTIKVIKILVERNIPIMFIGEDVRDRYVKFIPPIYPEFLISSEIQDSKLEWDIGGKFLKLNKYIEDKTPYEEIMWVDMNVPF